MTHLEDSKIIDLLFARSEQAIGELDKAHGAAVRKTAGNILWDRLDVEEIINDTYLGVWNSIPPHRPEPPGQLRLQDRLQSGGEQAARKEGLEAKQRLWD